MAGDWIKIEMVTPDKPEVDQMSEILGIDPDAVVGKLIRFWVWADQQAVSGHALIVTKKLIDRVTYCPGFADALLKVDWLQARSGSFVIPHFDRHNGQSAKNRALATERKRLARQLSRDKRDSCHDENVTEAGPEKRREEKSNKRLPPNPPPGGNDERVSKEKLAAINDAVDAAASPPPKPPVDCPAGEIVRSFNENLGNRGLKMVVNPTKKRSDQIRELWSMPVIGQDFARIEALWKAVRASKFLMGKAKGSSFRASFDWLISDEDRVARIIEGQYADEG